MAEAYPLQWPAGWPRTKKPQRSRFGQRNSQGYGLKDITMTRARDHLFAELDRLGSRNVVLSTNLALRNDGLPRANQRKPDDTGVAVYFTLNGDQKCFPCDKWNRVEDNIYAIAKTIEALRGIERWGSKQMVDATFNGFKALPEPGAAEPWHQVLGVYPEASEELIKAAYRRLCLKHHPDHGGTADAFNRIKKAYEEAIYGG